MIDSAGNPRPKSEWALTAIERLFDVVRDEMGLSRTDYDIVGFSGGAQFVHRLVLFLPEARFRRAVAASPGRYAFPSWSDKFPYGLAGSPIDRPGLAVAFSRQLVLLLGDRDVTDRARDDWISGHVQHGSDPDTTLESHQNVGILYAGMADECHGR